MADLITLVNYAKDVGATGLLVFAIVGIFRGWWVPGWLYQAKCRECEAWKGIAVPALKIADKVMP